MQQKRQIKAETNLIRLPLFCLDRQTSLESIKASGSYTTDEGVVEWTLEAAPNAKLGWPGAHARLVNMALLSLATEGGAIVNPITWRWIDLFDRMAKAYSGRAVIRATEALEAIHGLAIWSKRAIYDAVNRCPIEGTREATHLFNDLKFYCRGIRDTNRVWLSDWYLENLNAGWYRTLDYDLWLKLDQSHIASRMYEYLSYGQTYPNLSIGYTKLASYLPVTVYQELWEARRQLDEAMNLLVRNGVVSNANIVAHPDCVAMLTLERGAALGHGSVHVPEAMEIEVRTKTPGEELAQLWYTLWYADLQESCPRPGKKDVALGEKISADHGIQKARQIVRMLVDRMRIGWKGAKTFSACERVFLPQVLAEIKKQAERDKQKIVDQVQKRKESLAERGRQAIRKQWLWHLQQDQERFDVRRQLVRNRLVAQHGMVLQAQVDNVVIKEYAADWWRQMWQLVESRPARSDVDMSSLS